MCSLVISLCSHDLFMTSVVSQVTVVNYLVLEFSCAKIFTLLFVALKDQSLFTFVTFFIIKPADYITKYKTKDVYTERYLFHQVSHIGNYCT